MEGWKDVWSGWVGLWLRCFDDFYHELMDCIGKTESDDNYEKSQREGNLRKQISPKSASTCQSNVRGFQKHGCCC